MSEQPPGDFPGTQGAPLLLNLAPAPKSNDRFAGVLAFGALSTLLTLTAVYLISKYGDENVMGWYVNYILPAGAILVGIAASTGYSAGAWWTGLRVRGNLLWSILCLQLAAYFIAQYVEFRVNGPFFTEAGTPIGFWEYYHL